MNTTTTTFTVLLSNNVDNHVLQSEDYNTIEAAYQAYNELVNEHNMQSVAEYSDCVEMDHTAKGDAYTIVLLVNAQEESNA